MEESYQNSQKKIEEKKPDVKKLPDLIMQIRTLPGTINSKTKQDLESIITDLPSILDNIYSLQEDWLKIVSTLGDIVIYLSVHEKRLDSASKEFIKFSNSYIEKLNDINMTIQTNTVKSVEIIKENLLQLQGDRNQFIKNITDKTDFFNSILANRINIDQSILSQMYEDIKNTIILQNNSLKEEFKSNFEKIEERTKKLQSQVENDTLIIHELKKHLEALETKFTSPLDVVKTDLLEGKRIELPIYQSHDIVFSREEHKIVTLEILDKLINSFAEPSKPILSGSHCKQLLVDSRQKIYEKTAKIAPRFRLAMDSLIELFYDDLNYDQTVFKSVVEKIQQLKAIYEKAAVIET